MTLPTRLLIPAKLIFEAASKANVRAVLFGGAAVNLHGAKRETKDIDINVTSFKFLDRLPAPPFDHRPGSAPTRRRLTYYHPTDAIKCDLAINSTYLVDGFLERYSEVTEDGVRYASADMLLADKIRTFGQRHAQNPKRDSDLEDIGHLLGVLLDKNGKVPSEVMKAILDEMTLKAFWTVLPGEEHAVYRDFLTDVGIVIPDEVCLSLRPLARAAN
ncbi:hypothetical protein HETIRDRAFT_328102 [Heterobasidion irregulare TC 32-1]|uniref:Nucleotidyl transferase AbiEii/AbiGii toxin family protein n=1 Tax=Heterobasidion irregulare (strain TC 32-1) TaxID=747525 RepID=W4JUT9_HETIT|nr:uncharacterized protein HETIRDRAFT_328102 [Heterobasidion irregulare TC 32-1]ETW76840.1 hypothetical protein HETIRDRAFT_328102 [Heterobasidion irregulare TC 32-1]